MSFMFFELFRSPFTLTFMNLPAVKPFSNVEYRQTKIVLSSFLSAFLISGIYFQWLKLISGGFSRMDEVIDLLFYLIIFVIGIFTLTKPKLFSLSIGKAASVLMVFLSVFYAFDIFLFVFFRISTYRVLGDFTPIILQIFNILIYSTFIFSLNIKIPIKILWVLCDIYFIIRGLLGSKLNLAFSQYFYTDLNSYDYLYYKILHLTYLFTYPYLVCLAIALILSLTSGIKKSI